VYVTRIHVHHDSNFIITGKQCDVTIITIVIFVPLFSQVLKNHYIRDSHFFPLLSNCTRIITVPNTA